MWTQHSVHSKYAALKCTQHSHSALSATDLTGTKVQVRASCVVLATDTHRHKKRTTKCLWRQTRVEKKTKTLLATDTHRSQKRRRRHFKKVLLATDTHRIHQQFNRIQIFTIFVDDTKMPCPQAPKSPPKADFFRWATETCQHAHHQKRPKKHSGDSCAQKYRKCASLSLRHNAFRGLFGTRGSDTLVKSVLRTLF